MPAKKKTIPEQANPAVESVVARLADLAPFTVEETELIRLLILARYDRRGARPDVLTLLADLIAVGTPAGRARADLFAAVMRVVADGRDGHYRPPPRYPAPKRKRAAPAA